LSPDSVKSIIADAVIHRAIRTVDGRDAAQLNQLPAATVIGARDHEISKWLADENKALCGDQCLEIGAGHGPGIYSGGRSRGGERHGAYGDEGEALHQSCHPDLR